MTDFAGHIWVAQDNDDIALVCITKQAKNKLQVLNEKGREQRLAEEKLLWQYPQQVKNSEEWQKVLTSIHTKIATQAESIDVPLLWESAVELNISTIQDLADIYFSGDISIEQQIAVWQVLATDRMHFKRRGQAWEPRSAVQIAELKTQQQREQARAQAQDTAIEWLKQIIPLLTTTEQGKVTDIPENITPFIDQLSTWLKGETDKYITDLITPFAESLKLSTRELVFEILQKVGRLSLDADRDVIVFGLKPEFSAVVNEAVQTLSPWSPTQTIIPLFFSIDDEETREVDDALAIEATEQGWLVTIAVADPATFIQRSDPLDREAMRRGTTVYLPSQTVLMLPEHVSCDIASLTAGEVRASIVLRVWLDEQAQLLDSQISRASIKVAQRLHYKEADFLLATGQDDTAQHLRALLKLAKRLREKRVAEGAFILQRPEYKVILDEGDISVMMIDHHSPSRLLVAEMMILANYIAARYAQQHQVPIIYRTQEPPLEPIDREGIAEDPLSFHKVRKLLRPSTLSLAPGNHNGLGLSVYTQFTSPLRRFADLVMQRQLVAHLVGEPLPYNQEELYAVLETAERTAREARRFENEAKRRWFLEYLQEKWQDRPLPALIIEASKGGYKVETLPWGVEAFLGCQGRFALGERVMTAIEKIQVKTGYTRLRLAGRYA